MTDYEHIDMNETVRDALIEHARGSEDAERTLTALRDAQRQAIQTSPNAPRTDDVLTQVRTHMTDETLSAVPVHVARREIYSTPLLLAYAHVAYAIERWLEGHPAFVSGESSYLGIYESEDPSAESDAIILEIAADELAWAMESS